MSRFSMSHLPDAALMRELPRLVAAERASTAAMLAALAEVDARRLYAPLRYASLFLYCVGELKLSPDVAAKRIQAARAAREFPLLLDAIEDGRLNVSVIVLLAPHLTPANAGELVALAAGRTCTDLRAILAHTFQVPGSGAALLSLDSGSHAAPTVMEQSQEQDSNPVAPSDGQDSGMPMVPLSPSATQAPPAPVRFPLHASIAQVEKQRFGVGARTRPARRRRPANERTIPMAVRTEIFRRDHGHCTFVGDTGHRCESRHALEFDHVLPLARGGITTADNLRLRCRTHNHVEAERTFGAAFMRAKRERAAVTRTPQPAPAWQRDVLAALRTLGFREREARGALPACDLGPDATLEERVRAALRLLAPLAARRAPAA